MFDAAKQVAANGNSSTSTTTTTQVAALEHDLRLIEKKQLGIGLALGMVSQQGAKQPRTVRRARENVIYNN